MISGILIAVMLVLFPAMVAWAWSARRRDDFEQAAALALEPADHHPKTLETRR